MTTDNRRILREKIDEYRTTITIHITDIMAKHCPTMGNAKRDPYNPNNRSQKILSIAAEFLSTFEEKDFKPNPERHIVTITKPNPELYKWIVRAVKSGIALSRADFFRQAILWDIKRERRIENAMIRIRENEDKKNKLIRIPTDKGERIIKIIGVA